MSALYVSGEDGRTATKSGVAAADRLGEEFQSQGPWSPDKRNRREFYIVPQPFEYTAPPLRENPSADEGYYPEYPLCYNPGSGRYEYCYPGDPGYFSDRFYSPELRPWRTDGRTCPPGQYFSPGRGCTRN